MAHTEKEKSKDEKTQEVLEKGHIFWFYRPRVGLHVAEDINDVQRLYFALVADAKKEEHQVTKKKIRLLVMTSKKMPEPDSHGRSRHWAFVDLVADTMEELNDAMEATEYSTKTRGQRRTEPTRPVAEGRYEIVHRASKTGGREATYLSYVLQVPEEPGDVQEAFAIHKEASYICLVKNPTVGAGPRSGFMGLSPSSRPKYSPELQKHFEGKRKPQLSFIPLNPVDFLDIEHTQITLMGAHADLEEAFGELGSQLENETETEMTKDMNKHHHEDPCDKLYEDLHMDRGKHPENPLEGNWEHEQQLRKVQAEHALKEQPHKKPRVDNEEQPHKKQRVNNEEE